MPCCSTSTLPGAKQKEDIFSKTYMHEKNEKENKKALRGEKKPQMLYRRI